MVLAPSPKHSLHERKGMERRGTATPCAQPPPGASGLWASVHLKLQWVGPVLCPAPCSSQFLALPPVITCCPLPRAALLLLRLLALPFWAGPEGPRRSPAGLEGLPPAAPLPAPLHVFCFSRGSFFFPPLRAQT